MNRSALLHTLRGFTSWFILVTAGVYIAAGVSAGQSGRVLAWGGVLIAMALAFACARYRDYTARAAQLAERDAYTARAAARTAEHEAYMAELEADRAARQQAREDQERDDIAAGLRCPEWCDGCAAEQAESEASRVAFLTARAARHGHPSEDDLASIAPDAAASR